MKIPAPFLVVHVRSPASDVGLTGLCPGYEASEWRVAELAHHLMEWLPDFALSYADRESVGVHNMIELARKAAKVVYSTDKYGRRGEFGELLLHAAVRQVFGSLPAISKIYYKDSPNDTVKGFDAVHVVESGGELELWLGEAKLYTDIDSAIRDVCKEIEEHTRRDYLRTEFIAIGNKVDPQWKHSSLLRSLIHQNTSLDVVFARSRIPVLLTFDSEVSAHLPAAMKNT